MKFSLRTVLASLFILPFSLYLYAACPYYQVTHDCNSHSTTTIAREGTTSMVVHANWNQGTISYKFQSGAEKLDMLVSPATDASRLDTTVSYRNKSAASYVELTEGAIGSDDTASLYDLLQSVTPSFFQDIHDLLADLPQSTMHLQELKDLSTALLSHLEPPHENMAWPWDYAAYSVCYFACLAGGDSSGSCEHVCYHKYITKDY